MSTYSIFFMEKYGEIKKIIPELSLNTLALQE